MTLQAAASDNRITQGGAYKDKSKPTDIRNSNINAAKGNYYLITQYRIMSLFAKYTVHVI